MKNEKLKMKIIAGIQNAGMFKKKFLKLNT
jgi:hypothetical protein